MRLGGPWFEIPTAPVTVASLRSGLVKRVIELLPLGIGFRSEVFLHELRNGVHVIVMPLVPQDLRCDHVAVPPAVLQVTLGHPVGDNNSKIVRTAQLVIDLREGIEVFELRHPYPRPPSAPAHGRPSYQLEPLAQHLPGILRHLRLVGHPVVPVHQYQILV